MTEDQQAGTLAFLQNFYTNVTLYMPFGAEERAAAKPATGAIGAVAVPAAPTPATVPLPTAAVPTAIPPAAPAAAPVPVAPLNVPPAEAAPAIVPAATVPPVVATAPGKLPSLAALPPLPAARPATPAAAPLAKPPVAIPVAPAPPPAAPPAEAPYLRTTFNTLGSNAQGVIILVRLPETQFVKLPRNVFLNKLLQALQLVMADVVLVNVDGPYPVALASLRREIAATQVLAFGKNLLDVAVRTTQIYEPVQFPNLHLSYLAAAEVEMIEYDVSLKKRLWAGLKAMFLHA